MGSTGGKNNNIPRFDINFNAVALVNLSDEELGGALEDA